MSNSEFKDKIIDKIPLRIFRSKGKNSVADEQNIDELVSEEYNPEIENNKIKNKIKLNQNLVWVAIGTGSFLLIVANLLFVYFNLFFFTYQLTINDNEKVLDRLEKIQENARKDANDLSKMIIPALFTTVIAGIFNTKKEEK